MTLRDWALAAWSRPEVAATCLDLQDHHGQSVALLLWRLWAGPAGEAVLAAAVDVARPFETGVLSPLRAARRALGESDLKARVRDVELAAEFELLDRLETLAAPSGRADVEAPLAGVIEAWNGAAGEAEPVAARLAAAVRLC